MKIADRLFASLMFFTRLPWWHLREVPAEAFKHTVDFWPLVGWITGGCMALTFYLLIQFLPLSVALILTILLRLLLTGALHEDGLADFCDGMGGGTTRERVLTIMKDSHIGTFGVIGLIVYFSLLFYTLNELTGLYLTHSISQLQFHASNPILMVSATLLFSDVYAKSIASFIITLPYARNEETAKAHVVYHKRTANENSLQLLRIVIALSLPLFLLLYSKAPLHPQAFLTPILVFVLLLQWMKRKIGGYTGDCCGAMFLICELTFLISNLLSSTN